MMTELKQRGIEGWALEMGWRPMNYHGTQGWRYPIKNTGGAEVATRFKAESGGTPKYAWVGGKPDNVDYYFAPNVKPAMGGKLWLASGEPDLLTLLTAGYKNVFCTLHTELKIPDSLLPLLEWLKIETLLHAPDKDVTGMKAAAKLEAVLKNSSTKLVLYQLPGEVVDKHGKDLNSTWVDCEFDKVAFKVATMVHVEAGELDVYRADTIEEPFRPSHQPDVVRDSSVPDKFLQAIEAAINQRIDKPLMYKDNGWANHHCITNKHNDKIKSAGWHKNGAYNCFGCDTHWNAKETGEFLGLPHISTYYDNAPPPLTVVNLDAAPNDTPVDTSGMSRADAARAVLKNPQPLLETKKLYHRGDALFGDFVAFINGDKKFLGTPVMFPLKQMHQFGGLCKHLLSGMVVLIGGESGSGKTTLLETVSDIFCEQGVHNIYVSKEWKCNLTTARRVGRNMTDGTFTLNDALSFASNGHELPPARRDSITEVVHRLRGLPGQVHYYGKGQTDYSRYCLEDMLDDLVQVVMRNRANGHDIRVVIWDYIQLYALRDYTPGASNLEEAKLDVFKEYCEIMDVVGITSSQVTQGASKRVRGQGNSKYGGWLNLLDCQYLREDKCNLGLMWQQNYMTVDEAHNTLLQSEWDAACKREPAYMSTSNGGWVYHSETGKPVKTGQVALTVEKNSLHSPDKAFGKYKMDWAHGKVIDR